MGDGQKDLLELRFLHVLQHDALAAFLLHDAVVVGQVVGRGGDAVGAISCGKDLVDNANRGGGAEFGVAVFRVERQVVFELLEMRGKCG